MKGLTNFSLADRLSRYRVDLKLQKTRLRQPRLRRGRLARATQNEFPPLVPGSRSPHHRLQKSPALLQHLNQVRLSLQRLAPSISQLNLRPRGQHRVRLATVVQYRDEQRRRLRNRKRL